MAQEKRPAEGKPEQQGAVETPPVTEGPAGAEGEAARVAELEGQVAEMAQRLEAKEQESGVKEKEAREYLEGWQRERANFENFRKRMARELDDAGIVAKVELIRALLPAIDNLERALTDATDDAEVVRKGVRMTHDQLMAALDRQGVKAVPAQGEPFDPNVHEAIDAVAGTGHPADTVVEDLQKGYTLGDRLVRAARVRVAR